MTDAAELARPAAVGRRPVLITGGAGFIGSNLADRLASEGYDVLVYDSLGRPGVEANLRWLRERHPQRISAVHGDVRDGAAVAEAARDACAVFHFAAQVAVTTSLADPVDDFTTNVGGTLMLLEALRGKNDGTPLIFAGTNKVYGDLADIPLELTPEGYLPADPALRSAGISEDRPIAFHTPYGCSKGAADQYVLDYARSFGVPAAVMRMSCIYGPRQMGTEDQGWVAHFMLRAMAGEPITIFGDGRQVRDVLEVGDAVEAYCAAWKRIDRIAGRAVNLGGGPANAVSLRQVLAFVERLYGRPVACEFADWRSGDQRWYVSDPRAVRRVLELSAPKPWQVGLRSLAVWLATERLARREDERRVAPEAVS